MWWFVLYEIHFLFFSAAVVVLTLLKKDQVEGAHEWHEVVVPIVSMFLPMLINLAGDVEIEAMPGVLVGLIFFGAGLSDWGLVVMGRNFTVLIEANQLVKKGPYQVIKHPIYAGEALIALALAIGLNSALGYGIFSASIVVLVFRARLEERKLRRAYPDEEAYFKSTAMFLPFLTPIKKRLYAARQANKPFLPPE